MSSEQSTLGRCPACGVAIPRRNVLIEYEKAGETAVYAECPDCEVPVQPR